MRINFVNISFALYMLGRFQRRWIQTFLKPGGKFEKLGAERFKKNTQFMHTVHDTEAKDTNKNALTRYSLVC
jgi:hypothetical protein